MKAELKVMRKILLAAAAVAASMALAAGAWAAGALTIMVDGSPLSFPDAPAYIDANGRTQVPSRFVAEALGADAEWDGDTQTVTFKRQGLSSADRSVYVEFSIGSAEYYTKEDEDAEGAKHTMDTQAVLENGRTYIPVRFVAEALGAAVSWDAAGRTVTISSEKKTVGGFEVPAGHGDEVAVVTDYETNSRWTSFDIDLFAGDTEGRIKETLDILTQKIGWDSIAKIEKFMAANMEFEAKAFDDVIAENFLDAASGRHVRVMRLAGQVRTVGAFRVIVYDKGSKPLSK